VSAASASAAAPASAGRTRARAGRVSPRDLLGLGVFGLRTRPTRVVLSALGIAIGIAAMIAVVGISSSSQAALDRVLAGLGTNLLQVRPGQSFSGDDVPLPVDAVAVLDQRSDVEQAAGVGRLSDEGV